MENKREIKTYREEKKNNVINNYRQFNIRSCKNFNKINIYSYSIHRKSRQDNKGNPIFGEGLIDVKFGFIVNRAKKNHPLKNGEDFLIVRNYNGNDYSNIKEIVTQLPNTEIYTCNTENVRIYNKNNIKNTNKLIKIIDLNNKPIIE